MADYTQITSFGPKDALATGNAAKKIKGTEIDPELSAIATAIATKFDSGDVASDAEAAALTSDTVLLTPDKLLYALQNGTIALGSAVTLSDGSLVNAKLADMAQATVKGRAAAAGTGVPTDLSAAQLLAIILTVDGAGSGLDADTLDGSSSAAFAAASHAHATSDVTSGTFADARVAASNVTQHQASLSIAASQLTGTLANARVAASNVTQHQASLTILESQITDSTVLARNAGTETISGAWTYSTRPIMSGQGGFLTLVGSSNTGGSVTISASAASGTPGNGDVWIQYV